MFDSLEFKRLLDPALLTGDLAWLAQIFGVVLGTLLLGAVARQLVRRMQARAAKTAVIWDDALFDAMLGPTRGAIWVIGLGWAAHIAGRETDAVLFEAVPMLRDIGIIAMLAWFLTRFSRAYEDRYVQSKDAAGQKVDRTVVHAVGKLVRAAIVITAVLFVLQAMGINIAGLLAFGGVGGIAIGLAAKDLLANVFGGITIYLDRPFRVGDWIRSPDREIEGTVEEIGWRRTLIRTFDMRPLYVPNAVFTTISVENPSRMLNRRIFERVGVRYDDAARVAGILEDVRAYLKKSDEIDQAQVQMVNLDKFADSSLEFFIYCFTRTVVWTEYHAVKERVLLQIADIVAAHGGEIAFPTRTLHMPEELRIMQAAREESAPAERAQLREAHR